MIKRILALIIVLGALVLGGCSEAKRDTMTVELTWPWGDCDLGIEDPFKDNYWIDISPSMPHGTFSNDCTNGGTERWSLNYYHPTGGYMPMVYSDPISGYTGIINLKVTINGNKVYANMYEEIAPSDTLLFMVFDINRAHGSPSYKVIRTHGGERPQ